MAYHKVQRTLGLLIAAGLVLPLFPMLTPAAEATTTTPLKFGMSSNSVTGLTNAGVKPNYGTVWAGIWLQKSGWSGFDATLDTMYDQGVVPMIHFYYWGNDISKDCLDNGCYSSLHGGWKTRAGWQDLAENLITHVEARMNGRAVVIVIETEFNKNGVGTYENLDYWLAQKAKYFEAQYPASQPVLGFGNWGSSSWGTFDRAAAASTYVGIQAMRGSTRDSADTYAGVVTSLIQGSRTLNAKFSKPVFITDVALSSYTEPGWLDDQQRVVKNLMANRATLKDAGVKAIVYRSMYDNPSATTNEYYGQGERHFGLVWAANKTWKPAMKVWVAGIKAERATSTTTTSTSTSLVRTEGESFATKTTGVRMSDGAASADAAWNLYANGYMEHRMSVPAADTYDVKVRAEGTSLNGVAPIMVIKVDGVEKWRGSVGTAWGYYTKTMSLGSGAHTVRVLFINDSGDRNLHVDKVELIRR